MALKPEDILPKRSYIGGKNGESRTVVEFGSSEKWVLWAPTRERLPLGGFTDLKCTGRTSFAKWASMLAVS